VKTFKNWSSLAIEGAKMARYGFVHTPDDPNNPNDDTVTCIFCALQMHDWRKGDHPLGEHRRSNANCCQFIQL
jgi:hypothetical protein